MNLSRSCRRPRKEPSRKGLFGQSQAGQIVIEYVLLLAIAVSIAALMTKFLIGRESGNEGLVIRAWQALIQQVGEDNADDVSGGN